MKRKPPASLSRAAKDVWLSLEKEWGFTSADYVLLGNGMESGYDRLIQAQSLIRKHGLLLKDPKGRAYLNPACIIEKEAMNCLLRTWRLLNLKVPPPVPNIGRPPGDRRQREEEEL